MDPALLKTLVNKKIVIMLHKTSLSRESRKHGVMPCWRAHRGDAVQHKE